MTLREVRLCVREAAMGDPFKEGPTLWDAVDAVRVAQEVDLKQLSLTLNAAAQRAPDPKVKDALKKASGLAQHAGADLAAIESMVTIAVRSFAKRR